MLSIRAQYERHGVAGYYAEHAAEYVNPHAQAVRELLSKIWDDRWRTGLDFAAGAGLVTVCCDKTEFIGVEPYLAERYTQETGRPCLRVSAQDVAAGAQLPECDVIVISYALDLIPKTYLPALLWEFARVANSLVIIRPNSKVLDHPAWTAQFSGRSYKSRAVVYKKTGH